MNQRQVIATTATVLLLVAATDFARRIYVPRHHEARSAGSFVPAVVAPPVAAAGISGDLVAWLPKLRPVAPGSGTAPEAEWTLTLLAVFDGPVDKGAVIQAKSPTSGNRVQRVGEGDELFGYKVSAIAPLRVVLTGAGGTQELVLFNPAKKGVGASGPTPGPEASVTGQAAPAKAFSAQTADRPAAAQSAGPRPATVPPPTSGPPAPATTGPKTVDSQEVKPGQAFELPESMRGLKLVKTPPQPQKAQGTSPAPAGAPPPKKP